MKYWIQVLLIDTLYFRKTVFDNCFNIYGFYFSSPPPLISTHTAFNYVRIELIQTAECWLPHVTFMISDCNIVHLTPGSCSCGETSGVARSLPVPTVWLSWSLSIKVLTITVSNFISSFHVFRPWKKEVNRYWMDGWRDGWMDGWIRMHAYH